jgi:hypothetical protein
LGVISEDARWRSPVNRDELQEMARQRIKDAEALLAGGRWEFAYYTVGYAVECALKSCLLTRMTRTSWVFLEKWDARVCLTHEFGKLIELAGLRDELNNALKTSTAAGGEFVANWNTTEKWTVTSRYQAKTEAEAKGLYAAITADPHGVFKWIQNFW